MIQKTKKYSYLYFTVVLTLLVGGLMQDSLGQPRISLSHAQDQTYDGRLLLLFSTDSLTEPRYAVNSSVYTQQIYGMDVEGWKAKTPLLFNNEYGHPLEQLIDLPAGVYYVQALLHVYETFQRADGHTVKLPMDRGEGQKWYLAPGNMYCKPFQLNYDPENNLLISIPLDQMIPEILPPKDTKYVKHIKIKSEKLSEFWGRDMYLGAHVLLPEGWDSHPDVKYPLSIFHGHFNHDISGWRTTPPDADLPCEYSERFKMDCYNRIQQEEYYATYKAWTGPDFPRVIAVDIQHANPYYDDSYAVNSENLGPYGDAIMYELIPYIEEQFRGIGEGWARFTYGGSTGGWEALAAQVFYPDEFNGCYAACPDPIDFRHYVTVDIYKDKNAYFMEGPFQKYLRPDRRDYLGHVSSFLLNSNRYELAIGNHSRSGDQYDIWQAVYSPVGDDGYPQPIWDKYSGEVNHSVANYWQENFDLSYIMKRDWETLGPKLKGKVHIYCGDMDNYYLNNAVYATEEFLESTTAPYYEGVIEYGDRDEHCWNGDHNESNAISRLRYHRMFITKWAADVANRAPEGVDLTSWRY
jgi:hypothetical protein